MRAYSSIQALVKLSSTTVGDIPHNLYHAVPYRRQAVGYIYTRNTLTTYPVIQKNGEPAHSDPRTRSPNVVMQAMTDKSLGQLLLSVSL